MSNYMLMIDSQIAQVDARMVIQERLSVDDLEEYTTTDQGFPISGDHLARYEAKP